VAFSLHCMTRVRFSGAAWDYAHLVPVKRKVFATLQTDYVSAGLLCSSRPGLTWSGRKREAEPPVPAAEENIGQCEICVHDFVPNPSLVETKTETCEPDHARLFAGGNRRIKARAINPCVRAAFSGPLDQEAFRMLCTLNEAVCNMAGRESSANL